MIQNQYYYLVAGLPELIFDAEHKRNDLSSVKENIRENLEHGDYTLLDALFLKYDNENVLNYIKKAGVYNDMGTVPASAYDEVNEHIGLFPRYIREFLESQTADDDSNADAEHEKRSAEAELNERFYKYASTLQNEFLTKWFNFDRQLKNILAATNARKLGKEAAAYLIGNDELTEPLTKSNASDFGLRTEWPYMDKLMQAIDTADIYERERKIDMLRWDFIDEQNTFNYFNIDKVLGFVLKAMIIDRWARIDPKVGDELFKKYSGDLKATFDLNAAFEE